MNLVEERRNRSARKRYERLMGAFSELQAAAQKVVDETDRIYDGEAWPVKYRAPYDAIVELRQLLAMDWFKHGFV